MTCWRIYWHWRSMLPKNHVKMPLFGKEILVPPGTARNKMFHAQLPGIIWEGRPKCVFVLSLVSVPCLDCMFCCFVYSKTNGNKCDIYLGWCRGLHVTVFVHTILMHRMCHLPTTLSSATPKMTRSASASKYTICYCVLVRLDSSAHCQ